GTGRGTSGPPPKGGTNAFHRPLVGQGTGGLREGERPTRCSFDRAPWERRLAQRRAAAKLVRMAIKDDAKRVPPVDPPKSSPESSDDAQGHPEIAGATAMGAAAAGMTG